MNYSKTCFGDHPFVKLKVVAQNWRSLSEGPLLGTGIVSIEPLILSIIKTALTSCAHESRPIPSKYTADTDHLCICIVLPRVLMVVKTVTDSWVLFQNWRSKKRRKWLTQIHLEDDC